MNEEKVETIIVFVILFSLLLISTPQNVSSQFVIASWDYPDEYGQGIYAMRVYENSTGSWVNVGGWIEYYESATFDWNASIGIKIQCESTLNATLTGAASSSDGNNYLRHNVTVTLVNGTVVFSQQNFTYIDDIDYAYSYYVILNFLPEASTLYTVTVTYEVFW